MVMGTHHMLLSSHRVPLGATWHATGDVLPLNSVEPPPCPLHFWGSRTHMVVPMGVGEDWAGLGCGRRVTAMALPLTSSRNKLGQIFRCPLTQSEN